MAYAMGHNPVVATTDSTMSQDCLSSNIQVKTSSDILNVQKRFANGSDTVVCLYVGTVNCDGVARS